MIQHGHADDDTIRVFFFHSGRLLTDESSGYKIVLITSLFYTIIWFRPIFIMYNLSGQVVYDDECIFLRNRALSSYICIFLL